MTRFKRSTRYLLATAAIAALPLAWSATAMAASDDPSQAQSYNAEADKLLSKNDLRGAEIQMKNAVKAAPDNGEFRLKLARMELSLNDVDGALVELKAAREHGADDTKVIP